MNRQQITMFLMGLGGSETYPDREQRASVSVAPVQTPKPKATADGFARANARRLRILEEEQKLFDEGHSHESARAITRPCLDEFHGERELSRAMWEGEII